MLLTVAAFAGQCDQYARTPKFDVCSQTVQTYQAAFGRTPSASEITYWVGRNIMNYDQLISMHRQFIRSDAGEREATVRRAYQAAKGTQPGSQEVAGWSALAQQNGTTYAELVNQMRQQRPAAPASPAATQPAASDKVFIDARTGNLVNSRGQVLASSSDLSLVDASGRLISPNGAAIVAQGAGNIISNDGASIVSPNGGTLVGNSGGTLTPMYGVQSTGGKKTYEIRLANGRKIIVKK